ncbi:MAG TPA: porin family protein [Niabella sp.]|nr:porin family protein [Niabella sp.]
MKKIIVTITSLALYMSVYAQDVHYGVTAGLNISNVSYKTDVWDKPKSMLGPQIGFFAELPVADRLSIKPQLQYNVLGYKFPPDDIIGGINVKLNYITLPVTAQYEIVSNLKAELGIYAALLLNGKSKIVPGEEDDFDGISPTSQYAAASSYYDDEDLKYTKIEEGLAKSDFGLKGGFNYHFTKKFGAGIHYIMGLSNILTDADGAKATNKAFSISISYRFK